MDWAAADPTCSRPAPIVRHTAARPISPAALAYGWQDITTDRTVTIAGIDQLRARVQRQRLLGPRRRRLSLRRAVIGGIGITPYAAAQFTTFDLPAYAEAALVRRQQLCARLMAPRA